MAHPFRGRPFQCVIDGDFWDLGFPTSSTVAITGGLTTLETHRDIRGFRMRVPVRVDLMVSYCYYIGYQ